jgi:hypothetical protein
MLLALLLASCPTGDLALGKGAAGEKASGDLAALTGATSLPDGTPWNAKETVRIEPGGSVVVDLGADQPVNAIELQADADDAYQVEAQRENGVFTWLWTAAPTSRSGLVTRRHLVSGELIARRLRITPRGGDGLYSIAKLRVFCEAPHWAPERPPVSNWWTNLDDDGAIAIKGWIAALGVLVLLLRKWLRWLLPVLGLISLAAFFNFGHFHFNNFTHYWDFYHYYVGAKYYPELEYTRLYSCTAEAEAELFGADTVRTRAIRNLADNQLEPVKLDGSCAQRFSAERWSRFKSDIRYFKAQVSPGKWNEILQDHGFNGTPVWCILGRLFASSGQASQKQVLYLALIDPCLLMIMWLAVIWAFGWETACVGLIFWGTNFAGRFFWTGGSYLRMDWLAAAIIGICLAKKERSASGGFLLTYSALLRIFPGFIVAGLALKMIANRKLNLRFIAGCCASLALFLPLSLASTNASAWSGFVENSRKHLSTPLTNNMGLKTVISWDSATRVARARDFTGSDAFAKWKADRRAVFASRKLLYYALLAAFLLLLAVCAAPQPDWVALVLGIGLIAFAAELTNYYYSIFLGFALLWRRTPLIGIALLGIAAASCCVPFFAPWDDARYFDLSLDFLGLVIAATALSFRAARAPPRAGA